MPQSLYTPFATQMMGDITSGMRRREIGEAMKGAYMGAPGAMEQLMQLSPEAGMKVQQHQDQQAQQDLQQQHRERVAQRQQERQTREFAESNQELMQGLAEEISYFDDFEEAAAYNETQTEQLREMFGDSVPDTTLTPEAFEQIKQVYTGQLGENQETVGSPYMIEAKDDEGRDVIKTAVAVRDTKRGGIREVVLEGARNRAHALDPERAAELAKMKKRGGESEARVQDVITEGTNAYPLLQESRDALALIDEIQAAGGMGGIQAYKQRVQEFFGVDTEEVADMGELQTLLAGQLFDALGNFPGALSNKELGVAERVSSGTSRPGEVNKRLMQRLITKLDRQVSNARKMAEKTGDENALELMRDVPNGSGSPAGAAANAPQAALDYLRANPDQIDLFVEKFGYRPEGY